MPAPLSLHLLSTSLPPPPPPSLQVMAMDKEIFQQVAGREGKEGGGNKLASHMRQKADARQR